LLLDLQKMILKSIASVAVGFALIVVLAFATDTALQAAGVLPITGSQRFSSAHALLALSYHLVYAFLGCYITAWLAPSRPLAHAMVLGAIGVLMSALGLIAIVLNDLAPAWYGVALLVLSLPLAWGAGKIVLQRQGKQA
jgi:hypothetical protein